MFHRVNSKNAKRSRRPHLRYFGGVMETLEVEIKNSQIQLPVYVNNKKALVILLDGTENDSFEKIRNKLSKIPYSVTEKLIQERG
jgi:hypothetical protein